MDDSQNPQDQQIIEDAEIVQEPEVKIDTASDATVLTSLDELINSYIMSLDKLKGEIRQQKEMLQDGFMNDPVYKEHEEQAKKAAKVRNETKKQIMKQPAMLTLNSKVKTLAAEIKEKNNALSDYLLEYQRLSGANQFETTDGQVLEIINTARIVRKAPREK